MNWRALDRREGGKTMENKKQLDTPDVATYEADELVTETVFTEVAPSSD